MNSWSELDFLTKRLSCDEEKEHNLNGGVLFKLPEPYMSLKSGNKCPCITRLLATILKNVGNIKWDRKSDQTAT